MIRNLSVTAYCPPSSRWESELRRKSKLRAGISTGYSSLVILTGGGGGEGEAKLSPGKLDGAGVGEAIRNWCCLGSQPSPILDCLRIEGEKLISQGSWRGFREN